MPAFIARKVETLPGFGDKLREAREKAGLSLQKVSQVLNVKAGYLEKLEKGELDRMPPEVYTKAFLKRYSGLLELDEQELVRAYESELKILHHIKKGSDQHRSLPHLRVGRVLAPRYLNISILALVIIFAAGYLCYEVHFLISPPALDIFEPSGDLKVSQEVLTLKGRTDPGAKIIINGQELNVDGDGGFEQEITLTQGLNEIKIETINRFNKTSSVIRKILYQQPVNQQVDINSAQLNGIPGTN